MLTRLHDGIAGKYYEFNPTEKEARLFTALECSLNNECPPEKENYYCQLTEDESTVVEENCKACWIRWATSPYVKK